MTNHLLWKYLTFPLLLLSRNPDNNSNELVFIRIAIDWKPANKRWLTTSSGRYCKYCQIPFSDSTVLLSNVLVNSVSSAKISTKMIQNTEFIEFFDFLFRELSCAACFGRSSSNLIWLFFPFLFIFRVCSRRSPNNLLAFLKLYESSCLACISIAGSFTVSITLVWASVPPL